MRTKIKGCRNIERETYADIDDRFVTTILQKERSHQYVAQHSAAIYLNVCTIITHTLYSNEAVRMEDRVNEVDWKEKERGDENAATSRNYFTYRYILNSYLVSVVTYFRFF